MRIAEKAHRSLTVELIVKQLREMDWRVGTSEFTLREIAERLLDELIYRENSLPQRRTP